MNSHVVPYLLDISAVLSGLLGTLGGLYGAYALYPKALRRFTAAATTGLVGAVVSGLTVVVPALDVAWFANPGLMSFIVGAVVWEAYGFFLFIDLVAPVLEKADTPRTAADSQGRRNEMQPSDIAAWIWFRVAWIGGFGWAEIALLIAPHKHTILNYIVLTMLLGGIGGLLFGLVSDVPVVEPPLFSFKKLATVVGVVTILFSAAVFLISFVVSHYTGSVIGIHLPVLLKAFLYVVVTPIPIMISAAGFAPFAQWRMSRLSERAYGVIGIFLVLAAFLLQLVQPLVDIVHIHKS